jgi:hypothetical protein
VTTDYYAPKLFDDPSDLREMVRITDPETSYEAAEAVAPNKERDEVLTLRILREHAAGLTDFELADIAGRQQTSLGCRRVALVRKGQVEYAGFTRPSPSGRSAKVWRALK